ncbi:syndecan-2-like [Parambassis ranga]|uniref:Syndecan n=1 Tax=Parambassis ranga TaxID=210632 RepID=A0A6P7JYY6_9TELE|nr:syndecan-2-like [Parambassis ranga]
MKNLWLLFIVGFATGFISENLFVLSQSPPSAADDLYIEGHISGDLPIDDEDGEDDGSGSGSGDYVIGDTYKEEILRFPNVSKEILPLQPQPTADSPHNPPTTVAGSQYPETTVEDSEAPYTLSEDESTNDSVHFTSTTSTPFSENATPDLIMDTGVTDKDNSLDEGDVTPHKDETVINQIDNEILVKVGRNGRLYDSHEQVTSENLWERTDVLAAVIACGVVGFLCAVFLLLLLAYRMKKKDEGSYDLGDTKLSTTAYHKAPTKEFYA